MTDTGERRAQHLLESDTSVRRAIVRALEEAGVDTVFGMPGGYTHVIFDALYDHSETIRVVLVREESLASVMAQAYGRLTGRPAVVMGQGPFVLAAAPGIIEGRLSHTPMLVITDTSVEERFAHHGGYQSGSGEYGSWDAVGAFRAISTTVLEARGGSQTVQAVQLGIKHALTEPGSATVVVPLDSLRGRVGPASVPTLYNSGEYLTGARPEAPAADLARAVAAIDASERPVIIAGQGVNVSGAQAQLQELAATIGAPVVTTGGGKGAIAEVDPLSLGVFGTTGTGGANAAVSTADLLLVVGSRLAPSDAANENPELIDPTRQTLVQIDIDARNLSWVWPVTIPLLGDGGATMRRLREELAAGERAKVDRPARLRAIEALRTKTEPDPEPTEGETALLPQQLIRVLEERIPEDALVCCDAGENRLFMSHYFRTRRAGTFMQPSGVGLMGYAIPAAMAAKLVHPDRTAVAVCGDGGFAMTMNGLMTAIEEDLPIVVLALNNRSLGWVRHGQEGRTIASEFGDFKLAEIARSIGCEASAVTTLDELGPALDAAFASGATTVVEIAVSREESFERVQSPLARH
jgi:acetolactate synthase-1/2/3 large subunit